MDIQKLIGFIDFTHKFQQVKRVVHATGEDRNENDTEHSFQLAMTAWYLSQSLTLNFDENKLIRYGLVHDLVEIYAGDTYIYSSDQKYKNTKAEREEEALNKIKEVFPEFLELHQTIVDYESKSDPESKFIYALDKILPVMNIYLDKGRTWHEKKVSYQMIRGNKDSKIATSSEVDKIWHEFIKVMEANPDLFYLEVD